ncbi:hypothetical protein KDX38_11085 [Pseudomonas sp. CDFA 602]|uniref:hypothetical protein n=1 Tax=Pseudomonas californiensis TaxID=2829823 RepID=UPI001E4EC23E|nr:hypothetical protein [Pseudomonas californiensis]MCD5994138.1 hypothetical protein [Pseudomonas californiensis]MCD5999763.1 hypothetical protein [Pseudomonas californiensis]
MVDKVLRRVNGQTQQYTPVVASAGAADAGKIPALGTDGKLDPSTYNAGSGVSTTPYPATEAIGAGKFVNIYPNAGVISIRLADNSNNRPAHGFVIAAVANAAQGSVYDLDATNTALSGLTVGSNYFLGTAGGVVTPALDATTATSGAIDQKLGFAKSATELKTDDFDFVVL